MRNDINGQSDKTNFVSHLFSEPFEGIGERWTADESEAQEAYDHGFMVDKIDIVRAVVSTGQTLTTGLSTEWRGK